MAADSMFMRPLTAQQAAAKPLAGALEEDFVNRPDSARPGVYWYVMDGNLNGREMTAGCRVGATVGGRGRQ